MTYSSLFYLYAFVGMVLLPNVTLWAAGRYISGRRELLGFFLLGMGPVFAFMLGFYACVEVLTKL